MKKTWAIIAMMAAICCASCDEDKDEFTPCVENTRACSADQLTLSVCVNGEYRDIECKATNPNAWCSPLVNRCVECIDDQVAPVCDTSINSVKYCSDGVYKYTPCNAGKCIDTEVNALGQSVPIAAYCPNEASSTSECEPGAKRCNVNGQAQTCGTDHKWGAPVTCQSGSTCQAGDCRADAVCTAGVVQCDGNAAVKKCIDNAWQTVETCNVASGIVCDASSGKCEQLWEKCATDCKVSVSGTEMGCQAACEAVYQTSVCWESVKSNNVVCGSIPEDSGSDPDTDDDIEYYYCGNEPYDNTMTIDAYCQTSGSGNVGLCYDDPKDGNSYFQCYVSCTSVGSKGSMCGYFGAEYGYLQMDTYCEDHDGYKVFMPDYSSAKQCSACNAEGTACGEGGGNGGNGGQGVSTHTLGASCTAALKDELGCDGDTLVYCDGSKYVNALGGSYTCKDYGAGYYCDEQAQYQFADCVMSCTAAEKGYVVGFGQTCSNGKFELYVCEAGDSGNLGTFGGYVATSFCDEDTSMLYCSGENVTTKTCASCTNVAQSNPASATCK